jgi:hypothetical protein
MMPNFIYTIRRVLNRWHDYRNTLPLLLAKDYGLRKFDLAWKKFVSSALTLNALFDFLATLSILCLLTPSFVVFVIVLAAFFYRAKGTTD